MRRRWFILAGVLLTVFGLWVLDAKPGELVPSKGGRELAGEFFGAALRPALDYEDPAGTQEVPFFTKIAISLGNTLRYAVAAMSLATLGGLVGGILGSRAWWSRPTRGLEALRLTVRLAATAVRSVHELLWALIFLAAMGSSPLAVILALALPYAGTLAKVFSELFDESDDSAAELVRSTGGSGLTAFMAARVAQALPDLMTYGLYRLECSIRSSAVLGFVGVPTLGLDIKNAYEDGYLHQIWSYLYVLLAVLLLVEWWGSRARKALARGVPTKNPGQTSDDVRTLRRKRSHSIVLRGTVGLLVALTLWSWLGGEWSSGVPWERRVANLERFANELVPHAVREADDWSLFPSWWMDNFRERGWQAAWMTLHLGTVAALLAGAGALFWMTFSARSLATSRPRGIPFDQGKLRGIVGSLIRGVATIARSLPEYILAFLLLQMFGPSMWALVLALAIHNGGILLRLGAEVIDNWPSRAAEVVLSQGGSREVAFWSTLAPAGFNRLVLFLFYRWETCIREATVLGMLGVGSLGFLISESRVRFFYDEMLFFILLGAALVFAGDLTSDWVRGRLAKSGRA
ncbi:MAG: ABC transporter permease subunit [Verrucomicrobiota bacterium JB023]|nr:ABC transporter permease subunit [Verrucomicrobiota bacterium JB023]